jgi:hypothetical protein
MPEPSKKHDIYEDTCLHALVLADGVVEKLQRAASPEEYPKFENLADQLEEKACLAFKTNPEFREKLEPCAIRDNDSSEEAALAARNWLSQQMEEWAAEILSAPPVEPRTTYEIPLGRNPEKTLRIAFNHLTSLRKLAEDQFVERMKGIVEAHPAFPSNRLQALRAVFEPESEPRPRIPCIEIHSIQTPKKLILHFKSVPDPEALLATLPEELQPATLLDRPIEELVTVTTPALQANDWQPEFSQPFWKLRDILVPPSKEHR